MTTKSLYCKNEIYDLKKALYWNIRVRSNNLYIRYTDY